MTKYFLITLVFINTALAQSTRELQADYIDGQFFFRNYVKNRGAEVNTANVTVANSATVTRNTTGPIEGRADFSLSMPNNTNGSVTWSTKSLDKLLFGGNCEASAIYRASSMGSAVRFQVLQSTSVVAESSLLSTASNSTRISVNFPCGDGSSSTTVRFANQSGNSGTSAINVDSINVSRALGLGLVSQVGDWTPYTATFNGFGTVSTQSFRYRKVGETVEVEGTFTSGTVSAAEARVSLPSVCTSNSNYSTLEAAGIILSDTDETNAQFALIEPSVTYFTFGRAASGSAPLVKRNANTLFSTGAILSVKATARCGGFSPESVSRPETMGLSWSGYHDDDCTFLNTGSSFADPGTDASCTFTETNNRNFGSVASYESGGNKLPGIVFTPKKVGKYFVCAVGTQTLDTNAAQGQVRLADGSGGPVVIVDQATRTNAATFYGEFSLCGIYDISDLSSKTIRVQTAVDAGNQRIGNITGTNAVNWSIFAIDQAIPAPILVGSVTSNSSGAERIERATLTCQNSGSNIVSQSGSWISAISDGGVAGTCTVTIASGVFSDTPSCTCTALTNTTAVNTGCYTQTVSNTAIAFTNFQSGANTNLQLGLICMGPR